MRNQLSLTIVFLVLTLARLGFCGTIAQIEATAADITNMSTICGSSPNSWLGLCNSTCATCLATDSNKCQTCAEGYALLGTDCLLDTSMYNYNYSRYMGPSLTQDETAIANFHFDDTNQSLVIRHIVSICLASTYEFYTAGFFQSTDAITLQVYRVDPVDQVQVKLNFASIVDNMAFIITLNDNVIFKATYTTLTNLTGQFYRVSSASGINSRSFMSLPALSTRTAASIWLPVNTGLINYITPSMVIKFSIVSTSDSNFIWGFNDVVLLTRDCQTCVTKAVRDFMISTGVATGFTLIVVIGLAIILCLAIKFEDYQRRQEFQQKMGASSSSGNLPVKAINRVSDTVKRMVKAKDKELAKDDRQYRNAKQNKIKFLNNQAIQKGKKTAFQKINSMVIQDP